MYIYIYIYILLNANERRNHLMIELSSVYVLHVFPIYIKSSHSSLNNFVSSDVCSCDTIMIWMRRLRNCATSLRTAWKSISPHLQSSFPTSL